MPALRYTITCCAVVAPSTPGMTVTVQDGIVDFEDSYIQVVGVSALAIAAADPTLDRYDTVVTDSAGTVSVLTGTPGNPFAPDDSTKIPLGVVYVPAAATTITTVYDVRKFPDYVPELGLPQFAVADTFGYTFVSGALAAADPGVGKLGFDNAVAGSIAHLYVNYVPADFPSTGGTITKLDDWLNGASGFPYYLRLWSRQNRLRFILVKVTGLTDHGSWADLAVTLVRQTQEDHGAVSGSPELSTTALDTILEFAGEPGGVTSFNTRTGAVTLTKADVTGTGLAAADIGAAPSGVFLGVRNLLNGTSSYTPTSGSKNLYVECQAGGGAARAGAVAVAIGGSGAGAYSASRISSVNAGAHTVAIGAGGSAGANNGGDTSYTLATGETGTAPLAKGGATSGVGGASVAGGAGGAAGSGTGDITADGGGGGPSFWYATGTIGFGGNGGSSYFGSAANGITSGVNSAAGGLYGGGASGNSNKATSSAAGGNGLLRISEYA